MAGRLLEHHAVFHTSRTDVGQVAKQDGVKTLVLTPFVPVDDPALTDEMWLEVAREHFKGKVGVKKDLMELWKVGAVGGGGR